MLQKKPSGNGECKDCSSTYLIRQRVDDTSTWLPSHASGDKQRWTNSSGEGCISSQFLRFASVGRITQVWRGATGEKRRTNYHYTLLCGDSRRGVAAATRCESSRLVTPSHLCILCISKPYMSQCSYRLRVFLFGSRFVFVQHNGKLLGSKYAASRSQASILS